MSEKHVCKTATGGCMCQPDDDGVVRCRREAENLRTAAEARIEQHNQDTHQPVIMDDGEDLTYIDAMDQARDRDDAVARQDAQDEQDAVEAALNCLQEAQQAAAEGKPVACSDCRDCPGGQQLLREMEEERVEQIQRDAATSAREEADDALFDQMEGMNS